MLVACHAGRGNWSLGGWLLSLLHPTLTKSRRLLGLERAALENLLDAPRPAKWSKTHLE